MYQFIGVTNDETVSGLESILNYMNDNLFNKDEPAINEHRYRITLNSNITKKHLTYTTLITKETDLGPIK